jgi:hypothetical protein
MKGEPALTRPRSDGPSGATRGTQPTDEEHDTNDSAEKTDVVVVRAFTPAGDGLEVVRQRGDRLETGVIQRIEHGKPIHGEVVRLRPRPGCPLVCDVEVALPAPQHPPQDVTSAGPAASTRGPAKVASDRYRTNWDLIWKRPLQDGRPN